MSDLLKSMTQILEEIRSPEAQQLVEDTENVASLNSKIKSKVNAKDSNENDKADYKKATGPESKEFVIKKNIGFEAGDQTEELTLEDIEAMSQEDFDDLVENYDQLDELSKATLGSYIKKANKETYWAGNEAGHHYALNQTNHPNRIAGRKTFAKRSKGIDKAVSKLTKEDIEYFIESIINEDSIVVESLLDKMMITKLDESIENLKENITSSIFSENTYSLTEEDLEVMSQEDFDDLVENFEQLDELSKQTLGNYIKKAGFDARDSGIKAGYSAARSSEAARDGHEFTSDSEAKRSTKNALKAARRTTGIVKAVNKLTKEDIENFIQTEEFQALDELSKQTLGNYINKASKNSTLAGRSVGYHSAQHIRTGSNIEKDQEERALKYTKKRLAGIKNAVSKLTKEDLELFSEDEINELIENFEQLDELSKKTLASYAKKANLQNNGYSAAAGSLIDRDFKQSSKYMKKAGNRVVGINRAINKLTK